MSPTEQIDWHARRHLSAELRRWLKRQTAKARRRLGRLHLEDAPLRVTKGWAT